MRIFLLVSLPLAMCDVYLIDDIFLIGDIRKLVSLRLGLKLEEIESQFDAFYNFICLAIESFFRCSIIRRMARIKSPTINVLRGKNAEKPDLEKIFIPSIL